MVVRDWDPNEWQAHCQELLTTQYGIRVQLIPDRDGGDGGMEAYVSDDSVAFQCYAPDNPFTVAQQTESQKSKIWADTKKLLDNPARTCRIIGAGNVIREWVLLTPTYESAQLVEYANKRAARVFQQAELLNWRGDSFRISIHDDSLFAGARALLAATATRLAVTSTAPDLDSMRATGSVTVGIEQVLERKLAADPRLAADSSLLARYRDATLRDYFRGGQELERLAREVPSVHDAANMCADVVFTGLDRSIAEAETRPVVAVRQITSELAAMLGSGGPGLRIDLATLLARYFVASWWIQCPLQFEVIHDA